jgi:hypothetical protein
MNFLASIASMQVSSRWHIVARTGDGSGVLELTRGDLQPRLRLRSSWSVVLSLMMYPVVAP